MLFCKCILLLNIMIFFLKCINGLWFYKCEIKISNALVQKVSYKYTFIEIQLTDDLIPFKFTLHALLNICKSVTSMVIFFFTFCYLLCNEYLRITITHFHVRSEKLRDNAYRNSNEISCDIL